VFDDLSIVISASQTAIKVATLFLEEKSKETPDLDLFWAMHQIMGYYSELNQEKKPRIIALFQGK